MKKSCKLLIKTTLIIVLMATICKGSLLAAEDYALVTEWSASGREIAIDNEKNIYVTADKNILKFTAEGDFVTEWGYIDEDGSMGAWGIDVDSGGNVYVTDMWNNCVLKFTSDGEFITKWSTRVEGIWMYSMPQGIAVDNSGFVYVQHTSVTPPNIIYSCIQKYTLDGAFIKRWFYLWGISFEIATDNMGNVYAPGTFFGPLQKFSPDGELIDQWNVCSVAEVFCTSTGIALDSEGNVFISDAVHHAVKKYSPDGELIVRWELQSSGGFGSPPGPFGLAVDTDGYVYVIDVANDLIQKYGSVSDTTTTICPSEIALHGNFHQLQTLRDFRDKVLSITPEGRELIDLYYQWSPAIVKAMEEDDELKQEIKGIIDSLLPMIQELYIIS